MKQRTLELAQRTVEAFLHEQYADAELDVMSVNAEVDGYGDEFIWIYVKYDDSKHGKGIPDPLARLRLKARLRTELQSAEVDLLPVVSFVADSETDAVAE